MCVCVWFAACRTASPHPALSSNPSHYFAYWYSIRVPNLRLHPSCVPAAVHWCDNLYMHNTHARAQKGKCDTSQRNTTKQSVPQELHKEAVKREGGRSAGPHLCFSSAPQTFLFHGVYGRWILKRKQGCDVEKAHRSQSPSRRRGGGGRGRRHNDGGGETDLDLTHWYCQLR